MAHLFYADNLEILSEHIKDSVDLIYTDPPFNTGKTQTKFTTEAIKSDTGNYRFGGKYDINKLASQRYNDYHEDYYEFLFPRLEAMRGILKPTGSLFLHLDYREVHYVKIFLDYLLGANQGVR